MKRFSRQAGKQTRGMRSALALALLFAMLISMVPMGLRVAAADPQTIAQLTAQGFTDAGSSSGNISDSTPKYYVRLSSAITIFKSETQGSGVSVQAGEVLQLVAKKYYTGGDLGNYVSLYYDNTRYNALASGIPSVMSADDLTNYVLAFWKGSSFASLNTDLKLVGDVRVHALQYALQLTGYYSGAMDGKFGSGTESAVKAFQRANSLVVDGRAGPATQPAIYALAQARYNSGSKGDILYGSSGGSTGAGTTGTTGTSGTLVTTANVNLRKSASTSSERLAVVNQKTTLSYTDSVVAGGVTWYKVVYGGNIGWLMGSFVSAGSGGSGGGGVSSGYIGYVSITKSSTRVRKTPNGVKTGIVLAVGSEVPYYSTSSAAGYTWYYIQTSSGTNGYVRGDCAKVVSSNSNTGGGGTIPSSSKSYAQLGKAVEVFKTEAWPSSGRVTIPANTVVQLFNAVAYTATGTTDKYYTLYYNNTTYNARYDDIAPYIMSDTSLTTYITDVLWKAGYTISLKKALNLVGDVRVHGAQMALSVLGYYSGALDGNFGSGTDSAVRNFQRANKLTVDGSIGPQTWVKLYSMALTRYSGGSWTSGGTGSIVAGTFGTVSSVEMAKWSDVNNNAWFAKSSTATVLDVGTGQVFTIYRWSGGDHADCVPLTTADTQVMCNIVGFPYNTEHPSSSQYSTIVSDSSKSSNANYAWPDFPNGFRLASASVGNKWDRRPALLNVNGRVFCVSIYGWPHGISDSSFQKATRNGTPLYKLNNYYGMMCVHFVGSTTHSSTTPDSQHQSNIQTAYDYAKQNFPSATFK